jgi:hypothetical protein
MFFNVFLLFESSILSLSLSADKFKEDFLGVLRFYVAMSIGRKLIGQILVDLKC